jgi:hypothetical protein
MKSEIPRDNIEDLYPLCPLQQGILFHGLYAPEQGMYVEQMVCTPHGALKTTAFLQKRTQETLPLTPNGRIDRRLRALFKASTIADLATSIEAIRTVASEPQATIKDDDRGLWDLWATESMHGGPSCTE